MAIVFVTMICTTIEAQNKNETDLPGMVVSVPCLILLFTKTLTCAVMN